MDYKKYSLLFILVVFYKYDYGQVKFMDSILSIKVSKHWSVLRKQGSYPVEENIYYSFLSASTENNLLLSIYQGGRFISTPMKWSNLSNAKQYIIRIWNQNSAIDRTYFFEGFSYDRNHLQFKINHGFRRTATDEIMILTKHD